MSTAFCDSPFYLRIAERQNSPRSGLEASDSDSRIVDIILRDHDANFHRHVHDIANSYDTTSRTEYVKRARELETSLHQNLRPENAGIGIGMDRV